MNLKQKVFTLSVILVAVLIIVFSGRTKTFYGETISLTTRMGEKIVILGAENIAVSATSTSYFRIYSGDVRLLALPNDGKDTFSAISESFPTQDWQIEDGLGVDLVIASDHLLVVTQKPSPDFMFGVIYAITLASLFVILLGLAILSR